MQWLMWLQPHHVANIVVQGFFYYKGLRFSMIWQRFSPLFSPTLMMWAPLTSSAYISIPDYSGEGTVNSYNLHGQGTSRITRVNLGPNMLMCFFFHRYYSTS